MFYYKLCAHKNVSSREKTYKLTVHCAAENDLELRCESKLKARQNYQEWAFLAESFLLLETSYCIKVKDTEEAAPDTKTKAKLISTIDSSLYVYSKEVKNTNELRLWDSLKQLFDGSGFTIRIPLLRSLVSVCIENCSSIRRT